MQVGDFKVEFIETATKLLDAFRPSIHILEIKKVKASPKEYRELLRLDLELQDIFSKLMAKVCWSKLF